MNLPSLRRSSYTPGMPPGSSTSSAFGSTAIEYTSASPSSNWSVSPWNYPYKYKVLPSIPIVG